MEREKTNWVMDYETLKNTTVLCVEDWKTDKTYDFVIHPLRNDIKALINFLQENRYHREYHVSFNGVGFDAQISQFILKNAISLAPMSPDMFTSAIYNKAQDIIGRQNRREFQEYPEWKIEIPQIDVFKLNHWDNPAKMSGLKWIQYSMDWHNLQEMPIHHTAEIKTQEEIDIIVDYCRNDVKSTKKIMHLCKTQINLRKTISNKYDINCYNYSNTKIGSELLLKLYCDRTGRDPREVKKTGTHRDQIIVKDILFPYISFKTPIFQAFHEKVKNTIIKNTKGDFAHTIKYGPYNFIYGTGGIHQCIKSGVYVAEKGYVIKDLDVASLYPSIAIVNKMYPAHLGVDFYNVYKEDIVDIRLGEKAKGPAGDKAIIEGFKEAANASYGNSNSQHSWLFDPQYTMQTTINGQLLLTMLIEELMLEFPDAVLLQTNTDGATLKLKETDVPRYMEICKAWEKKTQLILEFADYEKMVIRDVNNYIGIYTNGKVKCKGTFEWEDLQNNKPSHLHKNKSFLIIPKAIYAFFVHGILPEQYLRDNTNIFDYCGAAKAKGDWDFIQKQLVQKAPEKYKTYTTLQKREHLKQNGWEQSWSEDNWVRSDASNKEANTGIDTDYAFRNCIGKEAIYEENVLQKTIRYYISNKGCKIIKKNRADTREIQVEAGTALQTLFNKFEEHFWPDYDVNEKFYLDAIYKEIANINPVKTQYDLFE